MLFLRNQVFSSMLMFVEFRKNISTPLTRIITLRKLHSTTGSNRNIQKSPLNIFCERFANQTSMRRVRIATRNSVRRDTVGPHYCTTSRSNGLTKTLDIASTTSNSCEESSLPPPQPMRALNICVTSAVAGSAMPRA